MSWATAAEALTLTGQVVTDADIDMAQSVVEMFADVTEDANDDLSTRDLALLKKAVAYQAVYMASNAHADIFSRADISGQTQDGMQFTYANKDAAMLSPWANSAISKLSWFGSGSIAVGTDQSRMSFAEYSARWLRDEEPGGVWHPLNMGY